MGELGALFNPGMRHEIEERKSKELRREEEGDSDPGDLRIDLFSGVAVIALGKNGPIAPGDEADPTEQRSAATARTDQTSAGQDSDDD
ncbi:MAG: DUF6191 domain-containing protein [Nakamurella sp.]